MEYPLSPWRFCSHLLEMAASTKDMILPSSTAQLHFLHRLAAHSRDGTRRTSFKYSQPRFIRAQSSRSDSIPCRVSIPSEQPNKQANYFSPAEAQDFKLLYESSRSPAPQLDFPSTDSWPSNEPTPSDSTWQESSPPKLDDWLRHRARLGATMGSRIFKVSSLYCSRIRRHEGKRGRSRSKRRWLIAKNGPLLFAITGKFANIVPSLQNAWLKWIVYHARTTTLI